MLMPASTGAGWFHLARHRATTIGYIEGRIKFISPIDPSKSAPMHDNIIIGFGDFDCQALADAITQTMKSEKNLKRVGNQ
jgi:hypothetical protein